MNVGIVNSKSIGLELSTKTFVYVDEMLDAAQ